MTCVVPCLHCTGMRHVGELAQALAFVKSAAFLGLQLYV